MFKKNIVFEDFNGEIKEVSAYFHLSQPEIVRLQVEYEEYGGLAEFINKISATQRPQEILQFFERILTMSYGEKSDDGIYFVKSEESTELFKQSAIYNALFMEMIQDTDVAVDFFNNLMSVNKTIEAGDN